MTTQLVSDSSLTSRNKGDVAPWGGGGRQGLQPVLLLLSHLFSGVITCAGLATHPSLSQRGTTNPTTAVQWVLCAVLMSSACLADARQCFLQMSPGLGSPCVCVLAQALYTLFVHSKRSCQYVQHLLSEGGCVCIVTASLSATVQ